MSLVQELLGGRGQKYRALLLIHSRGESSLDEIARELGITNQGAGKLVRELRDMFLLEEGYNGRRKVYRMTKLGEDILLSIRSVEDSARRKVMEKGVRIAENRMRRLFSRIELLEEEMRRRKAKGLEVRHIEAEIRRVKNEIALISARLRKMGVTT